MHARANVLSFIYLRRTKGIEILRLYLVVTVTTIIYEVLSINLFVLLRRRHIDHIYIYIYKKKYINF